MIFERPIEQVQMVFHLIRSFVCQIILVTQYATPLSICEKALTIRVLALK